MVGYESNMLEMIRKQNPGLSRRFNPDNAIMFKDYDDSSLANIILDLCSRDGLHVNFDVFECCEDSLISKQTRKYSDRRV